MFSSCIRRVAIALRSAALVHACLLGTSTAHASKAPVPPGDEAHARPPEDAAVNGEAPSAEARAEAKRLFELGLAYASEDDYAAAARAFESAQAAVPHPTTLFNLGLMYARLGRATDASHVLATYLATAPADSPAEQVSSVRSLVADLSASIGDVQFDVSPPAATLSVDGRRTRSDVPQRMDIGWHTAQATSDGYLPTTTRFLVSPRRLTTVTVKLSALPRLTVRCPVPDVRVFRDQRLLGVTDGFSPLELARLNPAETYVLVRTGYRSHEAHVDSSSSTLDCDVVPQQNGARLFVETASESARLKVDGKEFVNGSSLPRGRHRLQVNEPGFDEYWTTIQVTEHLHLDLSTKLQPLPHRLVEYERSAQRTRTLSQITLVSGAVVALVGAGILLNNTLRVEEMARRGEVQSKTSGCSAGDDLTATARSICVWDTYGYVALGVGGAAALVGGGLWALGPDPHRYDGVTAAKGQQGYRIGVSTRF